MLRIFEIYSGNQAIIAFIAFFIAILFSLSFHEFAHAFVAHKQGDLTPKTQGRLTFNPIAHIDPIGMIMLLLLGFGWAKPVQVNPLKFKHYRRGFFMVSIAGIIVNIILFLLFALLQASIVTGKISIDITTSLGFFALHLVLYMVSINLVLAIFNLLPIFPLDGYNMINAYTKHDNPFLKFMRQYGQIILLALLISGALEKIIKYLYDLIFNPVYSFYIKLFLGGL